MPRRVESISEPGYPSLGEYACGRRQFLRKLGLGALAVGAGRLLAACESSRGISGHAVPGELFTVRLPEEGSASAYLGYDEYMRFSVTLSTYDEEMAGYFRGTRLDALEIVTRLFDGLSCSDFETSLRSIERSVRDALEAHHTEVRGDTGASIHSLEIAVETCETAMAGDISEPGWP
jgi:hypothetical protein